MNMEDHPNLRVTVSSGILEGTIEPGSRVRSFKGIPFAAPLVGNLQGARCNRQLHI
jgi:carboxylesterase type B